MKQAEILRKTVAEFYGVTVETISGDFELNTPERQGSIARYALDAAIRRALNVRSRAVHTARTYGELERALLNGTAPADETAANLMTKPDTVACGIDLEAADALPEADDYFGHEFYSAHFTKAEIGYCVRQRNPRMHFAARWCAKEALKKCASAYLHADMSAIEVTVVPGEGVKLRRVAGDSAEDLPFAVSLTHTPAFAAAVVVYSPPQPEQTAPTTQPQTIHVQQRPLLAVGGVVVGIVGIALALAGWLIN